MISKQLGNLMLLIIVIILLFSSCKATVLKIVTHKSIDGRSTFLKNPDTGQEVVFIPMVHIGKSEYYKSVKNKVDELRLEGYVAFKEGVSMDTTLSLATQDTLYRKMRKIMGIHAAGGYTNKENKSTKKFQKKKYIAQDWDKLGMTDEDEFIDMEYSELIRLYEKDKEEIKLTPCDFDTELFDKYKCKDNSSELDKSYTTHILRNKHLLKEIIASDKKKIMVLYGVSHAYPIAYGLVNEGFEIIERGKLPYYHKLYTGKAKSN